MTIHNSTSTRRLSFGIQYCILHLFHTPFFLETLERFVNHQFSASLRLQGSPERHMHDPTQSHHSDLDCEIIKHTNLNTSAS